MKQVKTADLSAYVGGTDVCDFCAGVAFGALLTGNAILGGAATLCGVGCVFDWW